MMRNTLAMTFSAAALATMPMAAQAQEAPTFIQDTLPQGAVGPAWEEFQAVMGDGALDPMVKELVGLGVAAQIPCDYCVYYHSQAAEQAGASEEQIKEALAAAALVRKWSTMLQGSQYDEMAWQQQVDSMFATQ